MSQNRQKYVAGFLFSDFGANVALVRKNRPEWQAGLLNAIGGKIEEGEKPDDAMVREFEEETGVRIEDWEYFAAITGGWGTVFFYRYFDTEAIKRVKTMEDEEINVYTPGSSIAPPVGIVPNLQWLLPLASYRHDKYQAVIAVHEDGDTKYD